MSPGQTGGLAISRCVRPHRGRDSKTPWNAPVRALALTGLGRDHRTGLNGSAPRGPLRAIVARPSRQKSWMWLQAFGSSTGGLPSPLIVYAMSYPSLVLTYWTGGASIVAAIIPPYQETYSLRATPAPGCHPRLLWSAAVVAQPESGIDSQQTSRGRSATALSHQVSLPALLAPQVKELECAKRLLVGYCRIVEPLPVRGVDDQEAGLWHRERTPLQERRHLVRGDLCL